MDNHFKKFKSIDMKKGLYIGLIAVAFGFTTIQTSDLAKLALFMYISRLLSKKQEIIKDFKSFINHRRLFLHFFLFVFA